VKVLFYLPVVTPWWLENIISPTIAAIKRDCAVSVILPSPWSGTGVAPTAPALQEHADVDWYYLDGPSYYALRAAACEVPRLMDLVFDIDADYTFCRSADTATPGFFPGVVRFIMEYGLPPLTPLLTGHDFSLSGPQLFDRGFLPPMAPEMRSWLGDAAARVFETNPRVRALRAHRQSRREYCAAAGLPADKTIVAYPLEYESPENFFSGFRRHRDNAAAMEAALSAMGEDCCLAVTRHPLNRRYGGGRTQAFIAAHAPRVVEVTHAADGQPTAELIRQCDGVIVEDTKSIYIAALFGKPMLHVSRFACAAWMDAYTDAEAFFFAVGCRAASAPAEDDVRTWFGYGLANDGINLGNPRFGWADLRNRVDRPCDPRRWQDNLDFYARHMMGYFAETAG